MASNKELREHREGLLFYADYVGHARWHEENDHIDTDDEAFAHADLWNAAGALLDELKKQGIGTDRQLENIYKEVVTRYETARTHNLDESLCVICTKRRVGH